MGFTAEQAREHYQRNREAILAAQRARYQKNRAQKIAYQQAYRDQYGARINAARRAQAGPVERPCATCGMAMVVPAGRRHRVCDPCRQAKRVESSARARWRRRERTVSCYGLDERSYEAMLIDQGGVCALCHRPQVRVQNNRFDSLCIDHDHTSGVVRGLLCVPCNTALGGIDRLDLGPADLRLFLERIAVYVERG